MAAPIDVAAVQAALAAEKIDAWLLYDFRGLNPIAADLTAVSRQSGHLATRRWFYLIPSTGEPRALVHVIERDTLAHLPGKAERYAGRGAARSRSSSPSRRAASSGDGVFPNCAIPYVARTSTPERWSSSGHLGVEVVSSADLIQRFAAVWDESAINTHCIALGEAVPHQGPRVRRDSASFGGGVTTTEYDVQQQMANWFGEEGLVSDSPPNVSVASNAGNPHYLPTSTAGRTIHPDELVLLDLWGKLDRPGAVYADITWMGFTGRRPPEPAGQGVRGCVRRARRRDGARPARGSSRPGASRLASGSSGGSSVLRSAGYGNHILHRTGHSLGENVHGNGVNMDDYETHDDRRLLAGTGFTIEPGVYFEDFGVRSEINLVVQARDAVVTGPLQTEIVALV